MANISIDRTSYEGDPLHPADLGDDPIAAVAAWVNHADARGEPQANAMCLATADAAGAPSARTVLLKGVDHGLVFYTNYNSAKAADIAATGRAAVNFTWLNIHRQLRVEGQVDKVTAAESDDYFASRPHGSQLAAAASAQSSPIASRAVLENAFAELFERFPEAVPRPDGWGGYRLVPDRIEFWQGRRNRLHDRIEFRRHDAGWTVTRLAP